MKRSKILGPAGSDNYRVENMPVHLPKENMKFFYYMQDQANEEPFDNYRQYGNAYHDDWQERPSKQDNTYLKIMEAVNKGISKALNESNNNVGAEIARKRYEFNLKKTANSNFINAFLHRYPSYCINNNVEYCIEKNLHDCINTKVINSAYSLRIINLLNEYDENVSFYVKANKQSTNPYYINNFTFSKDELDIMKNCDYVVCQGSQTNNVYIMRSDLFISLLQSDEVYNWRIDRNYDKTFPDNIYIIPQYILNREIQKFNELDMPELHKGTMFNILKYKG